MKNNLFIILLLVFNTAFSQEIKWNWVKTIGSIGADEIRCINVDNSNNIIMGGYFSAKITLGNRVLKALGEQDILVIKLDESGEIIWINQAGSKYNENNYICELASKIVTDQKGNVFVAGTFHSKAFFQDTSIISNGNVDIFIAKYSPDGDLVWVQNIGNKYIDYLFDMKIDYLNNLYISGIHHTFINGSLFTEYYLDKISSSGSIIWQDLRYGNIVSSNLRISDNYLINTVEFKDQLKSDYLNISYNIDRSHEIGSVNATKNSNINSVENLEDKNIHFTKFYSNEINSNKSSHEIGNWINTSVTFSNDKYHEDFLVNGIIYEYAILDSALLIVGSYNLDNDINFNYVHYGYVDGFIGNLKLSNKTISKDSEIKITIFPNPTADYCQINIVGSFKPKSIKVMSLHGYIIKEYTCDKLPYILNLKDLPSGEYIIILEDDKTFLTNRIIIIS